MKLVLIGGARNDEDAARVESLRSLAGELGISVSLTLSCSCFYTLGSIDGDCVPFPQENVEFIVNASHEEVLSYLARASIGLSTMVDEHFGINVVEFMVRFLSPRTDLGANQSHTCVCLSNLRSS